MEAVLEKAATRAARVFWRWLWSRQARSKKTDLGLKVQMIHRDTINESVG